MSHNDFAIFIYDECEKCEMPKNPYHDKHGCPKEVEEECAKCDGGGTDFCDCNESEEEDVCCIGCNESEEEDVCCIGCNERVCSFNEEEEEYQWWGHTYTDERGNTISFFNATEKWIEENAEYKYNEYGKLDCFKDMR